MAGLSARTEDYLHAILLLDKKTGLVKVKDISKLLDIKAPTVTEALTKLNDNGLISHQKHKTIKLTKHGTSLARDIHLRYKTLYKLLTEILRVPQKSAQRDANGMKHSLSETSRLKMVKLVTHLSENPPAI